MTRQHRQVVVIGGGISGLTAAYRLKRSGVDVCLVEAAPHVGGCTATTRRDGFLLEKGPFNVIVRDPVFERLLDDLSDDLSVVTASPAARRRYVLHRGRLRPVPSNPIALLTTGLLSAGARCRLLSGLFLSRRAGECEETIEQAATRRFGREVSDTLVSAAVAGIFSGDIRTLSLPACFPSVCRVDQRARSLIGHGLLSVVRRGRGGKRPPRRWRGLVSIDGGLGAITEALGRRLGDDLRTGCRVEAVRSASEGPIAGAELVTDAGGKRADDRSGGEFHLDCRDASGQSETLVCDHVVLATPAGPTGRLLAPLELAAAAILGEIQCASVVVLNLGFDRADVGHPLDGFGFLIPYTRRDTPVLGVLFADSVFPHHAPVGRRLIRVFLGGWRDPLAVERSDDTLLSSALDLVGELLQLRGEPDLVDIHRHPHAIPQYTLGHRRRVAELADLVSRHPGLHLTGNYLEGVSLNDCVRHADTLGRRLADRTAHGAPDITINSDGTLAAAI